MLLEIVFAIVFIICGYSVVQYLNSRLAQHETTNDLLTDLIEVLNNKEDNEMRDGRL